MDRCDQAACLCCVVNQVAILETEVRCAHDADRILAGWRTCVEKAFPV